MMHVSSFRRAAAVVVLSVLFIAGCVKVGPDFKPPEVETPGNYRFGEVTAESTQNLKWWELFNDPVLYKLVTTALDHNRDIQIAASRIEEARAFVGFAKADQYPWVDIEGGAGGGNFAGTRSSTNNSNYFIAPVLSWEIDFWGKFRRATDAARAQLMASEYAYKTVQLSLISEVVSTYYRLLDFHKRLDVSRDTLKSRLEYLEIIKKRFKHGIVPELDVNQAQIQKELAAASIPMYARQIAKSEDALRILLGELPRGIETGHDLNAQIPPVIPLDLPSNILIRRPDIARALYLLKAETERVGVAEAMRFPSFSLTGLLGVARSDVSSVTSDGGIWSVSGGVLGPLIDFKKNIRRVEIQKEKTRQALYRYENTVLIAFGEVEDSLAEIQTYREELAAVTRQRKAAKNANILSKKRYDRGVASYLEVLDTERSLFDAELKLSKLKQQYLNAYVKLYKALGGGWITARPDKGVSASAEGGRERSRAGQSGGVK